MNKKIKVELKLEFHVFTNGRVGVDVIKTTRNLAWSWVYLKNDLTFNVNQGVGGSVLPDGNTKEAFIASIQPYFNNTDYYETKINPIIEGNIYTWKGVLK